jgi:hypothetical protein
MFENRTDDRVQFEHPSERFRKESTVTVLDDRQIGDSELLEWQQVWPRATGSRHGRVRVRADRPAPARPTVAPLQYRGAGIAMSRAPHSRRGVSTPVTVALACAAALITLWLGSLANVTGDRAAASAPVSDTLAVVQVQSGETLAQLAGRVAPDSPSGQTVQRIRELNKLDSVAVQAGQTLIAPIG